MTTKENYHRELIASEIILQSQNTLIISRASLNKVATLSEHTRAGFIEMFSGSKDTVTVYEQLMNLINNSKIEVDGLVKEQKELTFEKKKTRKEIESTDKRSQLIQEMKYQGIQFDLFKMYQNKKFLDSAFDGVTELEEKQAELEAKERDNFKIIKENKMSEAKLAHEKMWTKIELESMVKEYQDLEIHQQNVEIKSKVRDSLFKRLQESNECLQEKINDDDEQKKELEQLAESNEQAEETHQRFLDLKAQFEEQNGFDLLQLSSLKTVAKDDEIEHFLRSIERYETSSIKSKAKTQSIKEEIDQLKAERQVKAAKEAEIETKMNEVQSMIVELEELEKSCERTIEQKDKFIDFWRQKIITELKEKFPERVIGRLSELWTSVENKVNSDENFIKKRLKKFAEAIVVDNRETANECVAFLKIKCLAPVDEILLPLSDLVNQRATSAYLPNNGKLPDNFEGQAIEDLLKATSADVEKALVFCLKPALILSSLSSAEKTLKLKESKKLNVMSTEAAVCLNKNGFLERDGKADDILSEEEFLEADMKRSEYRKKIIQMKTDADMASTKLHQLKKEISDIDAKIQKLETSMAQHQKLVSFNAEKIRKLRSNINELQRDESRMEQQQSIEEQKKKIEVAEKEHYLEFCEALKVENIQKYLENKQMSPSSITKNIELLQQSIKDCKYQKAKNESAIVKLQSQDDIQEELQKKLESMRDTKLKIDNHIKESKHREHEHSKMIKELRENEKVSEDLGREIFEVYEKIYDNLNRVDMCLKDNYNILMRNFAAHNKLSFDTGSLSTFVIAPDNVPDGYKFVSSQLKL